MIILSCKQVTVFKGNETQKTTIKKKFKYAQAQVERRKKIHIMQRRSAIDMLVMQSIMQSQLTQRPCENLLHHTDTNVAYYNHK